MTVDELTGISRQVGGLVTCSPLKGVQSQRYWDFPFYSVVPGFRVGRKWPALEMDVERNSRFEHLVSSSKGSVALISTLTPDGDHEPVIRYYLGFTDSSDAVMFRLSWGS